MFSPSKDSGREGLIKMECKYSEERLSGLLDGELESGESREIEAHLAVCAKCRKLFTDLEKIDAVLKEHIPRKNAPRHLKEKAVENLQLEKIQSLLEHRPIRRGLLGAGITAAFVSIMGLFLVWRQPAVVDMPQAAIVNHINSLSGGLPVEIRISDPTSIVEWFVGKLSFRVLVPDLTHEGYKFVGGRLCHLNGLDVAYITYEKDGRIVSLFVADDSKGKFPVKEGQSAFMAARKGYCAACWRKDGLGYILVSDLPKKELEMLAESVRLSSS